MRAAGTRAPYQELDLVLKTARDLFTDDIGQIVIDDREQYQRLVRFVEMFMPERVKDVVLYAGDEPIFDAYGIEDEIAGHSRKVPLPSGGYLIIDQAGGAHRHRRQHRALRGKGLKDLEATLLQDEPRSCRRSPTSSDSETWAAHRSRPHRHGTSPNREKIRRRLEELLQRTRPRRR
jgi:ribonuclease G